jgi:TRAP-type mannitol/chloroaromatic compound transport system permease small subunit
MRPCRSVVAILAALDRILSLGERGASAAPALLLIMVIVASDLAMGDLFDQPRGWSYDVISLYIIVAVLFLALSRTFVANGRNSIDVLVGHLSSRRRTSRRTSESGRFPVDYPAGAIADEDGGRWPAQARP